MKEYKAMAHINSLKGEMAEITVLDKVGDKDYIVDYKGVKCHALFNWFVCEYYADDIHAIYIRFAVYLAETILLIDRVIDFGNGISAACLFVYAFIERAVN